MKKVTTGIMRTVFITRRYAIKVPSYRFGWRAFVRGLAANLNEVELWRRWKRDTSFVIDGYLYRDMLCPILWASWGGWIVVMPKVRVVSAHEYETQFAPWQAVFGAFADTKHENFGWLDNRAVCIDYGSEL